MDGFVLTLWIVRILFLLLIYAFLFAVVRVLLRDLRAASRGPAELGRLVVLASPRGEPEPGASYPARRGHDPRPRRQQRHRPRRSVRLGGARGADVPRPGWYVEDLESTNGTYVNGVPVEGLGPLGFGDELQVGEIRFRLDRGRG